MKFEAVTGRITHVSDGGIKVRDDDQQPALRHREVHIEEAGTGQEVVVINLTVMGPMEGRIVPGQEGVFLFARGFVGSFALGFRNEEIDTQAKKEFLKKRHEVHAGGLLVAVCAAMIVAACFGVIDPQFANSDALTFGLTIAPFALLLIVPFAVLSARVRRRATAALLLHGFKRENRRIL